MYPVSLLIHRWFRVNEAVALGIGTACTGVAVIVGSPVVTAMVEYGSLELALWLEAGFLLLCACICLILIRNWPDDVPHEVRTPQMRKIKRQRWKFDGMALACVMIGLSGNTAFQFLSLNFSSLGFAPFQVSTLISVVGVTLTISKFLFGEVVERFGAYRANWMFYGISTLGLILCCVKGSYFVAMLSMIFYGLGLAFGTISMTVYATDLVPPEDFEATVRQYQMSFQLGSLATSVTAGALADWAGSYVPFYLLSAAGCVLALLVIQSFYRRAGKTKRVHR